LAGNAFCLNPSLSLRFAPAPQVITPPPPSTHSGTFTVPETPQLFVLQFPWMFPLGPDFFTYVFTRLPTSSFDLAPEKFFLSLGFLDRNGGAASHSFSAGQTEWSILLVFSPPHDRKTSFLAVWVGLTIDCFRLPVFSVPDSLAQRSSRPSTHPCWRSFPWKKNPPYHCNIPPAGSFCWSDSLSWFVPNFRFPTCSCHARQDNC